jgi:hypothetical protein
VLPASKDYVSKWLIWWQTINPDWQERQGELFIRSGTGDWSSLIKSGINGWLTVFTSMLLLLHPDIANLAIWSAVLQDVSWSIQEVQDACRVQRYVYQI